jgi:hypothetical protein
VQLLEHRPVPRLLAELGRRVEAVGVDADLVQPLAGLLDAETGLRELERARPEDRAVLDEAPVGDDERESRARAT